MDADIKIIDLAVARLAEHFDTVQVFVTRHDSRTGTINVQRGSGNWFARSGQVREWLIKQDQISQCSAIDDHVAADIQEDEEADDEEEEKTDV
jgi:hypothetical protein